MFTKFHKFAISFFLTILSISSITAPRPPKTRSSDTSESSGKWLPMTQHSHHPPTKKNHRGPPFLPLHWLNVLQTLPKSGTLSSIKHHKKKKKSWFLVGSMMFHVRSTDMENVTSYNMFDTFWYYVTLTIISTSDIWCTYIHGLYVCNVSVQVSTPVSRDAISAGI